MTAPTGLGQYTKPQGSQGDRIQAQQMVDRPLLVWVRKTQHLQRTKFSATGGDAVYIDFVDLLSNQVYIEVMWMAGAIVDGLKQYAGDGNAYPVKVVKVQGGQWGSYQTIESLSEDPQWMAHIQANLPAFQQLVAQTRAQKEQEWAIAMQQAQQPPAPPQAPGMPPAPTLTPMGVASNPNAGLYDQAMAMQPPHVQQALQQPAPQQQPPQQYQQPAPPAQAPPAAAQVPAGPPPQYQQQAPQVQQPPAPAAQPGYPPQQQPQYPPQQYAPQAQQPAAPPQAAVAPPQYQQQAAPPGPPVAAAPPQQFQQAGPPPAAPVQQYAPQGLPQAPGAVTGQTVEQLTAALNQIG